ncbi:MAG: Peptidase rane alanine aminopeptidase [Cyanobacteria bacterium RYN_339]|nr:Peptidase rane alanine aminopeptidase [Cyanobacteria bacterium RYN_339]
MFYIQVNQLTPPPFLAPCVIAAVGECLMQSPPAYVLKARLDPAAHEVRGEVAVRFTNDGDRPLTTVWFQLYPNTFRPGSTYLETAGRTFNLDTFFPSGRDPGWIDVTAILAAGSLVQAVTHDAFLEVPLSQPLAPGQSISLALTFKTHVPEVYDRLGHVGEDYSLAYWYPRLAARDHGEWDLTPRTTPLQEFHDVHADFDVQFSLPARFVAGATGHLVEATRDGDRQVLHYRADHVRSFALEASPNWKELKSTEAGVTVHVLAREGEDWLAPRILRQTHDLVKFYGELVGPYPYADLTVVSSEALPVGGIELPQMVLNARLLARMDDLPKGWFEVGYDALNAHEIAHQWFFGLVGNDEAHDCWIDESFASYLTRRWLERPGAPEAGSQTRFGEGLTWWNRFHPFLTLRESQYQTALRQELNGLAEAPAAPLVDQPFGQVDPTYYDRGPVVLEMLRLEVGDEAFGRFLHGLYAAKFQNLDTAGVQAVAERAANRSLQTFFDAWVRGNKATLDHRLVGWRQRLLPDGRYHLEANVQQLGNTDMAVPVAITLADGRQVQARYEPGNPWVETDVDAKITGVMLDPAVSTLDRDYGNNGQLPVAIFPWLPGFGEPYPGRKALRIGVSTVPVSAGPVGANLNLDLASIRSAHRGVSVGFQEGKPVWSLGVDQPIYGLGNYDSRWAASLAQRPEGYAGGLELGLAWQPRVGENPTLALNLGGERRVFPTDPTGAPAAATNVGRLDLLLETRKVLYGVRAAGGRYRLGVEAAPPLLDNAAGFVTPSVELAQHVDLGWFTTMSGRLYAGGTMGQRDPRDELRLEREGQFREIGLGSGESLAALNLELARPLSGALYPPGFPLPLLPMGIAFANLGWAGAPVAELGVGLRLGVFAVGQASVGLDWAPYNTLEGFTPGVVIFKAGYGF